MIDALLATLEHDAETEISRVLDDARSRARDRAGLKDGFEAVHRG